MSQPTIEAYGFDLPLVNKPTNLQDLIDLVGADKVYDYADKYRTYHIIAQGARDQVLDAVEAITGIKPLMETKTKKDKDGKDVNYEVQTESDQKYVARALAAHAQSRGETELDGARAAVMGGLKDAVVDYSKEPEGRRAGPKKPGVNVTKRAQGIHAKGADTVNKTVAGLRSYLGDSAPDVQPGADGTYTVDQLAELLVAFDKYEEKQKADKLAAIGV